MPPSIQHKCVTVELFFFFLFCLSSLTQVSGKVNVVMEISVTFLLTGCLIQGVLCGFSIDLPEKVEALQGSCVFIPCTFDIKESFKEQLTNANRIWKNNTDPYVVVFDSSSPSSGQLKGEIMGTPTEKNCTTRFDNLRLADTGSYHFRIEGSSELKYSFKKLDIVIIESPPNPTVHQLQDEQEMTEGNSVTLRCTIKIFCASRPPSLTWSSTPEHLINENVTKQQYQNQTHLSCDLTFILTLSHHRANFTCTATYQLQQQTTTSRTHQLNVQYAPKSTSAHVNPAGVVVEGGTVTLSCSSDGNPAVKFTWNRHTGGELKLVQTRQQLTIGNTNVTGPNLTISNHNVTNPNLNISYSNVTDRNLTISNTNQTDPNMTISYTNVTGPFLTISNTNPSHSGLYYCRAENQHGTQNTSIELDVQYPPKHSSAYVNGVVVEGGSVTLNCSSDGNPAVNYTWYRHTEGELKPVQTGPNRTISNTNLTKPNWTINSTNLTEPNGTISNTNLIEPNWTTSSTNLTEPNWTINNTNLTEPNWTINSTNQTEPNLTINNTTLADPNLIISYTNVTGRLLTISNINPSHSGLYYCIAENQHGIQNTSVLLDVQYAPKSTSAHVHPAAVVVEGNSVTLSCSSDGNPAVNYTWYRHTEGELKPVQTGPNRTISNTNSSHSGQYYCTAQNQHGIQKTSVLLDVQFPPKISSSCSRNGKLTCTCEAHGNPLPNLQWRLSGKNFSSPAETSITKENNISLKRTLSIQLTDSDVLQCFSVNIHGSASHQFQPFTKPQEIGVHHPSMLLGFVIGASIFLILCVLTVCKERRKHRRPLDNRQDDTSGLIMTESAVMSDRGGHYAYANKSLQYTQSTWGSLHYSTIDFTNIEPVSEEVRGLSTLTEEYATIRHQTTETHTTPVSAEKTTPPEEMIYENMSHNSVIAENISIVEQSEGH